MQLGTNISCPHERPTSKSVTNGMQSQRRRARAGRRERRSSVWTLHRLRRGRCQPGAARRRRRRCNTSRARAQAQLLERLGVQLARGAESVGLLKLFHRVYGCVIPLPAGFSCIRAVFCERVLDFRNAVRGRLFLTASRLLRRSFCASFASLCGARGFFRRGTLRLRGTGEHT